jgi:hypothetical protein
MIAHTRQIIKLGVRKFTGGKTLHIGPIFSGFDVVFGFACRYA